MRFFNTAGPVNCQMHYCLPPLSRFNLEEIDALVGDTLISVLRQLRAGYPKRPRLFPQTVVLCGVRDVRDYCIHSDREKAIITGGRPTCW